jgi:NTE family protein
MPAKKTTGTKSIALALQGGGAHGAFAWGVLDKFLEDGRVNIEGVSATSAGAMNGAVLAQGLISGGPEGARKALTAFWKDIAKSSEKSSPFKKMKMPWDAGKKSGAGAESHTLDNSPMYLMTDLMLRILSPYQFNPMNVNPLRDVLKSHVDFNDVRAHCPIKLYLCATNVETGKIRIFKGDEVSIDAVLASACLPFLFQAIEIDGQHYWDGGYVGNPAIYPLIYNCTTSDVVIVHINPIIRKGVPKTASEILNRLNEVSFNSSLMREMRAIGFVSSLIEGGKVSPGELKQTFVHSVRSDETMTELGVSSKLNADWDFLCFLRDRGREVGEQWLEDNFDALGTRSTVDLTHDF